MPSPSAENRDLRKSSLAADEGIGASVRRVEDGRFLRGAGRFVDDIRIAGELHCVFLRSPHAHAAIRKIETTGALTMPGVAAIFTGDDMATDGIGPMRALWTIKAPDGSPMAEPPRWALARGSVRHVGEAVAVIVADSLHQAMDAAEAVAVDYAELPAVIEARQAALPGAPRLHECADLNICFRWVRGDAEKVRNGFARAARIVKLDLINQRICGAAIEPRCVLALPTAGTEKLTLYSTTQVPHHIRRLVAEQLNISEGSLRVIAPDVGGGFGYKGKHYPEEVILPWIARRIGRPMRWTATRSESFVSDYQARDHDTQAELALDAEGHFLALRVTTIANIGAFVSTFGAAIPSAIYSALLAGVYLTPAIEVRCTGVFTNTVPTDAYRGAGRPEACYVLERLADQAAFELGIDRAELRARNLIPLTAMPYQTPIGPSYDSGDFPKVFARAMQLSDYGGFGARRAAARRQGRLRGIGIACFVESSGVAPSRFAGMMGARAGFFESASITLEPDGTVHARLGTHSHGQGHATSMAQILNSQLGVPISDIRIIEGDTDNVPYGTGTFGSRSIAVGGSALKIAAGKIIEKSRLIAAHLLEVSPGDIRFLAGEFFVVGTNLTVSLSEVARAAYIPHDYPLETLEPGLQETAVYDPKAFAFSNGVHVCEVEIDVDTGILRLDRYVAVDDVGIVINPMIATGQVHGGIVQGFGQAVMERCEYDVASGQALSGSFTDYAVPRAGDLPWFKSEFEQGQPCTHNPLGAKGCGEAGTIAAPAAIVGAALDAMRSLGVKDLEMPLTPDRIWQAIQAARQRSDAAPLEQFMEGEQACT
jgi:aerobic carbon-monoxide dehydrogenase large subunit